VHGRMRWWCDTAAAGVKGDFLQLLKVWMPALRLIICAIILFNLVRKAGQSMQQTSTAYPFTCMRLRLLRGCYAFRRSILLHASKPWHLKVVPAHAGSVTWLCVWLNPIGNCMQESSRNQVPTPQSALKFFDTDVSVQTASPFLLAVA
jgi:hypothetical protein